MTTKSQSAWIHLQLIAGRKLTHKDAERGCNCSRLAARVFELRQRGYRIKSRLIELRNGKRVAEYSKD